MTALARGDEGQAAQLLQEHGLRVTGQRVQVLGAMLEERRDVTAQALHERLRAGGSALGLATVYRALNALADAGALDRLQHGSSTCYRRCSPGHHHHLVCDGCHRVVELRDCELAGWAESLAARHGFRGVRHTLELAGTCAACVAPA